VAVAESCCQCF